MSLVMSEMGKRGGKIGGKRSMVTMTPEERSERARKASMAAAKKRAADRLARARKPRAVALKRKERL